MKRFEWDDEKAEANWRKHGIRFAKAIEVFDDPCCLTDPDDRFDEDEQRWQTIGMVGGHCIMLFVAHTIQDNGVERRYGNRKLS